jgi:hypothetical protein
MNQAFYTERATHSYFEENYYCTYQPAEAKFEAQLVIIQYCPLRFQNMQLEIAECMYTGLLKHNRF